MRAKGASTSAHSRPRAPPWRALRAAAAGRPPPNRCRRPGSAGPKRRTTPPPRSARRAASGMRGRGSRRARRRRVGGPSLARIARSSGATASSIRPNVAAMRDSAARKRSAAARSWISAIVVMGMRVRSPGFGPGAPQRGWAALEASESRAGDGAGHGLAPSGALRPPFVSGFALASSKMRGRPRASQHDQVGAQARQVGGRVLGVGARDDAQRGVGGARLLDHLPGLERLRNGHQETRARAGSPPAAPPGRRRCPPPLRRPRRGARPRLPRRRPRTPAACGRTPSGPPRPGRRPGRSPPTRRARRGP